MSQTSLLVGPFNRVEGDLEIRLQIADGRVAAAYTNSPMFRGFERMLLGKPPLDALTITPRICGICSISQSVAAARALADAAGIAPAPEGARVAALLHAVENMSDHLTHFHLFFMPDFARPDYAGRRWHDRAVARFTAMEGSALKAAVEQKMGIVDAADAEISRDPDVIKSQMVTLRAALQALDDVKDWDVVEGIDDELYQLHKAVEYKMRNHKASEAKSKLDDLFK